ncbi:MAG: ATP-NAD kinase [Promethearchaeota archaeon]|nr:MAG: ATP-NAD kinase [Candidatus Lokiarchaeota archaeon]
MQKYQHKIGFVINPISGMGGAVGLKGTDGLEILERAKKLGAEPQIQDRAKLFLNALNQVISNFILITPPGIMGGDACKDTNTPHILIKQHHYSHELHLFSTDKADTQVSSRMIMDQGAEIIVFLGGDGTARDIVEIIQQKIPCLGIPGGVKVYSSIFAASPLHGAQLVAEFLKGNAPLIELEVLDINEQAFRENKLDVELYGFMLVPNIPLLIQGMKQTTPFTDDERENQQAIARTFVEEMTKNAYYIFGPGTTIRSIFEVLNLEKTLLGIDIVHNNQIIARDANEDQILKIVDNELVILVLTPIGRQGFVFGRGNLQITARVLEKIKKQNIHIICSRSKLATLPEGCIRTDIRDPEMDQHLIGYYRVLIDYNEYKMIKMI